MIKKDCKDLAYGSKDLAVSGDVGVSVPHKAFCDRWLIDLATDGSTCHQCEHNPAFVEKVLLPNRIKVLEGQYKPEINQSSGMIVPAKRQDRTEPCDHEGEETVSDRRCCGGKIEKVKIIYCHHFKEKKEKSFCLVCPKYSVEKI